MHAVDDFAQEGRIMATADLVTQPSQATLEDNRLAAEANGLVYVDETGTGIRRKRFGKAFAYYDSKGRLIRDSAELKRIRSLAVPPAYADVWICADPQGHIQATGRDERGRKQYRYHPRWREARDQTKYEHMVEFAKALPELRAKVAADMGLRGLPRLKVLATVVNLLDKTLMRVGNMDYAKENKSYGLTTLRSRHVEVNGTELRFEFRGKSGKLWRLAVADRRVARVVRACQELPGQHLFQYVDDEGSIQTVTSSDVNDYLREVTGRDITAKDFRTWGGTVLVAMALMRLERAEGITAAKRNLNTAIKAAAICLGNTPTICRKCYVHPQIMEAYLVGELMLEMAGQEEGTTASAGLRPEEAAVLAFLEGRLSIARAGAGKRQAA
jgi:DNA topoisomerase I